MIELSALLSGMVVTLGCPECAAAHSRQMNDIAAAQQVYADAYNQMDSGSDGSSTYYLSGYEMTPEQEAEWELRQAQEAELNRLRQDPKLMRFVEGYWEFYQSRDSAEPGEYCAATYANMHGLITLSGTDKSWDGGLLTFVGKDIPAPAEFRRIRATLTQTGDPPATIEIFNPAASDSPEGMGSLVFAVPSLRDALAGMENEQEFAVAIEGQEVFRMSWKDGVQARNALRRCVSGR